MRRRQSGAEREPTFASLAKLEGRIRPPVAVVLGSPRATAALVTTLPTRAVTCYQMDLHPADRLRAEMARLGQGEQVVTAPDLWDLPPEFETVLYPAPRGGERILKLDMLEQAFHILRPGGHLFVFSPYESDLFFPKSLKKIFGQVHNSVQNGVHVSWCRREEDRPRRRHELTFHARVGDLALRFLSRPGTFSYGRFDAGARALVETMEIRPGDHVLDLGCGCGTNGCFAGHLASGDPDSQGRRSLALLTEASSAGRVTFVDSNVRAVALAGINAAANGVATFETSASHDLRELPEAGFDVILANPPYFAHDSIARHFTERGLELLRPGGRFYLVTKQADPMGTFVADVFGEVDVLERRGYTIFAAVR